MGATSKSTCMMHDICVIPYYMQFVISIYVWIKTIVNIWYMWEKKTISIERERERRHPEVHVWTRCSEGLLKCSLFPQGWLIYERMRGTLLVWILVCICTHAYDSLTEHAAALRQYLVNGDEVDHERMLESLMCGVEEERDRQLQVRVATTDSSFDGSRYHFSDRSICIYIYMFLYIYEIYLCT